MVFVREFSLIEHMFVQMNKTQVMYYSINIYYWTRFYVTLYLLFVGIAFEIRKILLFEPEPLKNYLLLKVITENLKKFIWKYLEAY